MADALAVPAGLDGVVVAETAVGDVCGDEGFFHYRGYPAPALAMSASVEEAWHLLHRGRMPEAADLRAFRAETAAARVVPPHVLEALSAIARVGTPMAGLRTALSLAGQECRPWIDLTPDGRADDALRLTAMMPALVAALWRSRCGLPVIPADPSMGVARDYLRMLGGVAPTDLAVRAWSATSS